MFSFLREMDSKNNHFSLPSFSCFLIISQPASDSKCPRQINLKTDWAGLLGNEVCVVCHITTKTFSFFMLVTITRNQTGCFFMDLDNFAYHLIWCARTERGVCVVLWVPWYVGIIMCVHPNSALMSLSLTGVHSMTEVCLLLKTVDEMLIENVHGLILIW